MLRSFGRLALLLLAAGAQEEEQQFDRYAGYLPKSSITDQAAIDLDQLSINQQFFPLTLENARNVYRKGGYSGSFAMLTLVNLPNDEVISYPAGTKVLGQSDFGDEVVGFLQNAVTWNISDVDAAVNVTYQVMDRQKDYVNCQLGGLTRLGEANREGCFMYRDGNLTVRFVRPGRPDSDFAEYEYAYDLRTDTRNFRTLQQFSLTAEERMKSASGSGYFGEYQQFVNYYGNYDYADHWLLSALDAVPTDFENGRGNSDFSILSVLPGRSEPLTGTAYLVLWMEVVHELDQAVAKCNANEGTAVQNVDAAVAYYTGSLTTEDNGTAEGILLYALANVLGRQSRTAGQSGDSDSGDAYVNLQIMEHFNRMQGALLTEGTLFFQCSVAEESKDLIVSMMKVFLFQGVLQYAHIREYSLSDSPDTEEFRERALAEGATFAAAVLPFLHECGPQEAEIVHSNMRVDADLTTFNFGDVRSAMESLYPCVGVTCELVGGVWDGSGWSEGGEPCGGPPTANNTEVDNRVESNGAQEDFPIGLTVGVTIAAVVALIIGILAFKKYRGKAKSLDESHEAPILAVAVNDDPTLPPVAQVRTVLAVPENRDAPPQNNGLLRFKDQARPHPDEEEQGNERQSLSAQPIAGTEKLDGLPDYKDQVRIVEGRQYEDQDEEMQSVSVKPIVSEPEKLDGLPDYKDQVRDVQRPGQHHVETTNDARPDPSGVEPAPGSVGEGHNGSVETGG